jgi:hypothetical protein
VDLFIDQGTQLTDIVAQQVRYVFIHSGLAYSDIYFEGGMKLKIAHRRSNWGPVPFAHRA